MIAAKFLRGDLPYFVELLGEVAAETNYQGELRPASIHAQSNTRQTTCITKPSLLRSSSLKRHS